MSTLKRTKFVYPQCTMHIHLVKTTWGSKKFTADPSNGRGGKSYLKKFKLGLLAIKGKQNHATEKKSNRGRNQLTQGS